MWNSDLYCVNLENSLFLFSISTLMLVSKTKWWLTAVLWSPVRDGNFNVFKYIYIYFIMLFRYVSTDTIIFVLQLKMANLQWFTDWLIIFFHDFTCRVWELSTFSNICYWDTFSRRFWLILYTFSTISPVSDGNINIFKYIL